MFTPVHAIKYIKHLETSLGIISLSCAALYEVATKQEKLAKLESLLGRALQRAAREQDDSDDDGDGLATIMEEVDDDDDDNGAKAENIFRHIHI